MRCASLEPSCLPFRSQRVASGSAVAPPWSRNPTNLSTWGARLVDLIRLRRSEYGSLLRERSPSRLVTNGASFVVELVPILVEIVEAPM